MANKRRPKKSVVPYRKYVAGVGYVTNTKTVKEMKALNGQGIFSDDEVESLSSDLEAVNLENYKENSHLLPMELYAKILDYAIDFDNDENFNPKKRTKETKAKIVYKDYALVSRAFYYLMIPRLYNSVVNPNLSSFSTVFFLRNILGFFANIYFFSC